MPPAIAMPNSAPVSPSAELWLLCATASRKTTVSKPSRSTARNAIMTSARVDPFASAAVGGADEVGPFMSLRAGSSRTPCT